MALGLTRLPAYTAKMVPNAQLLEIQVIDTDPQRAAAVANEVANQLILQTPAEERDLQQRRQYLSRELKESETVMDETKAEIQRLRTEMANMFSARQIADTQGQIAALEQKLTSYRNAYLTSLDFVQGGVNTLQVVEPAEAPTVAQRPEQARHDPAGRGRSGWRWRWRQPTCWSTWTTRSRARMTCARRRSSPRWARCR